MTGWTSKRSATEGKTACKARSTQPRATPCGVMRRTVRPVRAKALHPTNAFAPYRANFATSIYPGRCPGLCAFGLSARFTAGFPRLRNFELFNFLLQKYKKKRKEKHGKRKKTAKREKMKTKAGKTLSSISKVRVLITIYRPNYGIKHIKNVNRAQRFVFYENKDYLCGRII